MTRERRETTTAPSACSSATRASATTVGGRIDQDQVVARRKFLEHLAEGGALQQRDRARRGEARGAPHPHSTFTPRSSSSIATVLSTSLIGTMPASNSERPLPPPSERRSASTGRRRSASSTSTRLSAIAAAHRKVPRHRRLALALQRGGHDHRFEIAAPHADSAGWCGGERERLERGGAGRQPRGQGHPDRPVCGIRPRPAAATGQRARRYRGCGHPGGSAAATPRRRQAADRRAGPAGRCAAAAARRARWPRAACTHIHATIGKRANDAHLAQTLLQTLPTHRIACVAESESISSCT